MSYISSSRNFLVRILTLSDKSRWSILETNEICSINWKSMDARMFSNTPNVLYYVHISRTEEYVYVFKIDNKNNTLVFPYDTLFYLSDTSVYIQV